MGKETISVDYVEKELREALGKLVLETRRVADNQLIVVVPRSEVAEVAKRILERFRESEAHLSTHVATDERLINGHFVVTYWISVNAERGDVWIGIRAYVPPSDSKVPSLTPQYPGANWYEREARDLLGIEPVGHPDPRRLVVPDDLPKNFHPLRKEVKYYEKVFTEPSFEFKKPRKYEIVVPFGPYHVALDEPAHFRLYVKGEEIVDVDYRGFYNHRGIEKLAESRLTYNQIPFIAERICGICGFTHSTAYCQAVETAAKIEVPDRARYIRTIMLEIERIHSHLLWIGVACHLVGFDTGFMHAWRIRERIMWLAERLSGNRKTYGMNLVGGVRRDILEYRKKLILDALRELRKEYKQFVDMLVSTKTFIKRCEGVGVLPRDKAQAYGTVGPTARGSGRRIDVRKDHPYAAYKELDFRVPVYSEGDVLARAMVRIEEVLESIWIIEQALDKLPGGHLLADVFEVPPHREALGYTEAPRGENVHYVRTGHYNRVYRWRVRASTYNNLPAVPEMLRGYTVADAPLIIASIDPCYSCTERVVIIDVRSGEKRVLSEEEFNALSRKSKGLGR